MFDVAKKYVDDNFRKDWDNYFKIYKGKRVYRQYEGISDPVIRESFTIIETLVANIAGGNPTFHFVKTNEEQTDDVDVLNALLDYWVECNQMMLKNQEWVREMLLYGTGILHVTWENGKPKIDNCPLRDFFSDPKATALVGGGNPATYAGMQYLIDKEVAKRQMVYSAEDDKMVPKYKNLDDIGPDSTKGSAAGDNPSMDKAFKDGFQGSTLGDEAISTQIHVILIYDLISGKLMEIGNRKDFIRYVDIPFQREEQSRTVPKLMMNPESGNQQEIKVTQTLDKIDPFLPFAVLRDYIDTSLFYGEGEMAIIAGRAETLNDLEAMDQDNLAYQNTPMYTIDPQFADLAPEIETIPGAVYPIPKGALQPMPITELAGNLDEKKDRVSQQMRNSTAADEAVQGVSQDQGRVTATEVSSTLAQAQNRFSTKVQNLENEGYAQLGTILFKLAQIFLDTKTAVRIVGPMGVHFKDFDPWEFNGEWEPHVELDSTMQKKQMEVGQKNNQIYQQLSEDPHNVFDPIEIKRYIIQSIDPSVSDERFNQMLSKTPAGPTPEQVAQIQKDAQKHPMEMITFNYKDAGDWTQSQIEQMFGLKPDPMHVANLQTAAMEHGAKQADFLNAHTTADNQQDPSVPPVQPPMPPEGMDQGASQPQGANAPQPAAA